MKRVFKRLAAVIAAAAMAVQWKLQNLQQHQLPVSLQRQMEVFLFKQTSPGMSDRMDAGFVCE